MDKTKMDKIKEKINSNIKLICICVALLIIVIAVLSNVVNSRVSNKEEVYNTMIEKAQELKNSKNWEAQIKSKDNNIKIQVNNEKFIFDTNNTTIWGSDTEILEFDKINKKIKDVNFKINTYIVNPWEEDTTVKNYINELKMKKTSIFGRKTYTISKVDKDIQDILTIDRKTFLPIKRKIITKKTDGKKVETVIEYNYKIGTVKEIKKPEMKGYKYNGEVINKTNSQEENEAVDINKTNTL